MSNNPIHDLMYKGESGKAGYNAWNRGTGNGAIRAATHEIDFSQLTLGEVQRRQHLSRNDPDYMFAVGKYQVIPLTMDLAARTLRLDPDQPFTPELQDRIFSDYLLKIKQPGVAPYITGHSGDLRAAMEGLSNEWASFSDPRKGDMRSHYGNGNNAHISLTESETALRQLRSQFQEAKQQGFSDDDAWRKATAIDHTHQVTTERGATAAEPAPHQGDFNAVMRTMLPPQAGVSPHMTSDYGPRSISNGSSNHRGVDFNYVGGQSGINLRHPTVHSPVSGVVLYGEGQGNYGTVKIRDDHGHVHEILHLDSRSVRATEPPTRINAGDPIGTMGGRGPDGAGQYAQHVHYQVRDPHGQLVDPERFWNGRTVEQPTQPGAEARTQRPGAMADGLLRQGERGPEVVAAQEALNTLGYTGRDGRPLETRSGIYGAHTRHAVEDFQRSHGLKVDGVIGNDTRAALATAAQRPLLSEATHPNHRLHAEIARQLPAGTPPEAAANVTLQAMENGVTTVDKLARVDVRGHDVFVMGTTPGDRVRVDLQAPTPGMQQMSDHTRQQTEQSSRQHDQPTPSQLHDSQALASRTMAA